MFRNNPPRMLVFRRGKWYTIELPFSDPMLTKRHYAIAAAVTINHINKGASFDTAIAMAEKIMYDEILGISREQHHSP